MSAEVHIPDLEPDETERFVKALQEARQWVQHPSEAELEKRIHTITQIVRGERVTTDNLNLLIGWYACNLPLRKQHYLSNVRLLQRVLDENDLPQEWLGRVVNQISKYATRRAERHALKHRFMDPMEAIMDLSLLHGVSRFLDGENEQKAHLAFHAIYRPKAVSSKEVMEYYRHYETYQQFWENLVTQNSEDTHVPRELVLQAQDALDHCMQEKLKVSRVISKAIYRPAQVSTHELQNFLAHYSEQMDNLQRVTTREGFPKSYAVSAKKAIADLVAYHELEIPKKKTITGLQIKKPAKPVDPDTVQKFAQALTDEMYIVDARETNVRARLRIFSALLRDPDTVFAPDVELVNESCDGRLRTWPPEKRETVFSNRELLTRVAQRANISPKYISHAFDVLKVRGEEVGVPAEITIPPAMLEYTEKPVHGHHTAHHQQESATRRGKGAHKS